MASACFEIETSRAISAQILRHKSFSFQEFSQRYAPARSFQVYTARRQDTKNRQNSIDDISDQDQKWFIQAQHAIQKFSDSFYNEALERGIAKESARFLLPMSTTTRLYMAGTIRSWIHYLELRCAPETQLEHREIAIDIRTTLKEYVPVIAEVLHW